jgi:hypothetical protein
MKIIERIYNPVNVQYMGVFMPVPPHFNFLATDENGKLYGYRLKPTIDVAMGFWRAEPQDSVFLAQVDLQGKDWRESLAAV